MSRATPEMIAAAWAAWHSRHGGKLGPGPAFIEAINAALGKMEPAMTQQEKTSNPAHVSQMTALTDEQIGRAELKLAEVLAGYQYVMPLDGMRKVLEAAGETPPSPHMAMGVTAALKPFADEADRLERLGLLNADLVLDVMGNVLTSDFIRAREAYKELVATPAPSTREQGITPVDNQPVKNGESGD